MEKIKTLQVKKLLKPNKKSTTQYESLHTNFWFVKKDQQYMFKLPIQHKNFKFCLLNEVFISNLCEKLQINCQKATFAEYNFRNQKGVLIKSFLNGQQTEISVDAMQQDFVSSKLDEILGNDFFEKYIYPIITQHDLKLKRNQTYTDKVISRFSIDEMKQSLNKKFDFLMHFFYQSGSASDISISFSKQAFEKVQQNFVEIDYLSSIFTRNPTDKDVVQFAKIYAKKHNLILEPNFADQICAYAIFDYLTIQDDRNTHNISFIKDGKNLKVAPLFDNGLCFTCNYNENNFELCKNKYGINILLTDLTKSKLENKDSLVYKYKTNLQQFLENGYDEFVQEFLEKYPESFDYIFTKNCTYDNDFKTEFLTKYFANAKESIKMRLEQLEQNKNTDINKGIGILENEPLRQHYAEQEKV